MAISERVAELLQRKNGDPLKGVYSNAAGLWLEMSHCPKRVDDLGCVLYEGKIPKNLRKVFGLSNNEHNLTITVRIEEDGENRSQLLARINNKSILFTAGAIDSLNDRVYRFLTISRTSEDKLPLSVKAGSVEHKAYTELLNLARMARTNNQNQHVCSLCDLKDSY